MGAAIEIEKLTKRYGRFRGITELNLHVERGEFFGYIGPNGAGKSTTIRTLMGMLAPTGGRASVLGLDVRKDSEEIRRRVGYLPSEAVFYEGMRVREILKLSADLRKKDCRKEAERLCEALQLDTTRRVEELSFGNRKKVGIVCALQHEPELLILDEPTSGLDPLMQKLFFDLLRERNERGAAIFLSTHILSEVQQYCSRAAFIREGSIVACDRIENLARTKARRIMVQGSFSGGGLSGIRDFQTVDGRVSFLYSGSMNELIRVLAREDISDLSISEPSLEEIFLHYYAEGGGEA